MKAKLIIVFLPFEIHSSSMEKSQYSLPCFLSNGTDNSSRFIVGHSFPDYTTKTSFSQDFHPKTTSETNHVLPAGIHSCQNLCVTPRSLKTVQGSFWIHWPSPLTFLFFPPPSPSVFVSPRFSSFSFPLPSATTLVPWRHSAANPQIIPLRSKAVTTLEIVLGSL